MLQPRAMFRHGRRLRCKGALLQAAITFWTLSLAPPLSSRGTLGSKFSDRITVA